ncbi:MAG: hypothetical protein M5U28_01430 [Sandaracinaceae bacterium]|nr:hypothetical protein [Sandaracinaceae bacterium]
MRRFPDRHAQDLIGWFGVVREIEQIDRQSGEARLRLELRPHQDRHLCADETSGSCRVTVAERGIGPFTALVTLRPEELATGTERLWTGSLVKVYGHVVDAGSGRRAGRSSRPSGTATGRTGRTSPRPPPAACGAEPALSSPAQRRSSIFDRANRQGAKDAKGPEKFLGVLGVLAVEIRRSKHTRKPGRRPRGRVT